MKLITTSWDDGHQLDFRIAELLDKYNLQGTFYIPRSNQEHEVMGECDVVKIGERFEIGGHTLNHVRLKSSHKELVKGEIIGSFFWLKDLLGTDPVSFCFPGGEFDEYVINEVRSAGFKILRTTELLNVATYQSDVIATTIQLYEHSSLTYVKHLGKRRKVTSLINWLTSGPTSDLLRLTDHYLSQINCSGKGCFHLWGHSWEIKEFNLWNKLEAVLQHLSMVEGFISVPNKELRNI
jgi:peptidoglycan-N-acetylglucosamine deacetylase